LGQGGLIKQLTGKILQRALETEMGLHLKYKKHYPAEDNSGNSRNGHTLKTILTENQEAVIQVPRDRSGTFESQIARKYQKRVPFSSTINLALSVSKYFFGQ
jgi:transposase-like protein